MGKEFVVHNNKQAILEISYGGQQILKVSCIPMREENKVLEIECSLTEDITQIR